MFPLHPHHKNTSQVDDLDVPKGTLESSNVHLRLTLHQGVPSSASKLSFDPAQRLLAVGTLDGRIKLLGKDGIQGILVSDLQTRCKFLEFANNFGNIFNITAENDIQIWDLEKRVLIQTHRWNTNITAFAVVQGSSYMYIGEDSGDVAVLQYDREENRLCQMPYSIPVQDSLGGIPYNGAPSVVGILLFPESNHNRVLLAYSNGLLILWEIYEARVLRVRGTGIVQLKTLDEDGPYSLSDEEGEEKDICCACWADAFGNFVAVGYTDGDIWFWDLAITVRKQSDQELLAAQSGVPFLKLQVSSSTSKSPVLALRWCATEGRDEMTGVNGHLYVYGGADFGSSDILMIFSLKSASGQLDAQNICHIHLPLTGLFDDMLLLPRAGGTLSDPASALLVLTSPGQLHVYDEASITNCLSDMDEKSAVSLPEPIFLKPFLTQPSVTAAKIVLLPEEGEVSKDFTRLPGSFKSNVPFYLPGGTKWPVSGGILKESQIKESKIKAVFITGHADGSVNAWNASSSLFSHLCSIPGRVQVEPSKPLTSSVSHLDFCSINGVLVVAQNSGVVVIYTLSAEAGEVACVLVNKPEIHEQNMPQDAGFQSFAVLSLDEAPVSSLAVASYPAHVAVGYVNGTVLLFDISLRKVVFHDTFFIDALPQVVSLTFGPILKTTEKSGPVAPLPPSPSSKVQSEPSLQGAIYAVAENASVVAISVDTGKTIISIPCHANQLSKDKAVSLHCVELSLEQRSMKKFEASEQSAKERMTEEIGCSAASQADLTSCYLLLCTQVSVYIYNISSLHQMSITPLQKVDNSVPCCWASTFVSHSTNAIGIVLLDDTGSLQIRSIPDLKILKEISLAKFFKWESKSSDNCSRSIVCADNGHIVLVDASRELAFFSLLPSADSLSVADTSACFFDKDIATAVDAALRAGSRPTRRKSQFQDFVGGVLKDLKGSRLKEIKGSVFKEIKGGLLKSPNDAKDRSPRPSSTADLSELFASLPLKTKIASAEMDRKSQSESADLAPVNDMDIDDIIIDDEISPEPVDYEPTSGEDSAASSKGKEKQADVSDDRMQLLGEDGGGKPTRRTAEEIKAKYGHRATGEVSGAAGLARDKLLERQEKLQALGKRTEEMQEGAENFASMATELAKAIEGRKWWQL